MPLSLTGSGGDLRCLTRSIAWLIPRGTSQRQRISNGEDDGPRAFQKERRERDIICR